MAVATAQRSVHTDAAERAREEFAAHEMTVLLDQGLYRHLRFRTPGTFSYSFDLVTWPGHLAVVGDIGDHVFCRLTDMVEFFAGDARRGTINEHYWAQKLVAPSHMHVREWSWERYEKCVAEWLDSACDQLVRHQRGDGKWFMSPLRIEHGAGRDGAALLRQAVSDQLTGPYAEIDDLDSAHRALRDFEHDGVSISDSWEWDLTEYRFAFLLACWAVSFGVRMYLDATAKAAAA